MCFKKQCLNAYKFADLSIFIVRHVCRLLGYNSDKKNYIEQRFKHANFFYKE